MRQTTVASTPFSEWLRGQLEERGWGVRTLARRIDPARPEIPRRALNRYLNGSLPTEANRIGLARGLGIDVADVPSQEVSPVQGDPFREVRGGAAPAVPDGDGAGVGGAGRKVRRRAA